MDQQALKRLVNRLIDEKLKTIICIECKKKQQCKKLSLYNYNVSVQSQNKMTDFEFSSEIENKENCLSSNRRQVENRVKASKSQALDLRSNLFVADISVIRPISQISSPTGKAIRKKSMPFLKKDNQQSTYERVLKSKK